MLLRSALPSALERLRTFFHKVPEGTGAITNPRKLSVEQAVWAKTLTDGKGWATRVIGRQLGDQFVLVRVEQGSVRRHTDHLRQRKATMTAQTSQSVSTLLWDINFENDIATLDASKSIPLPLASETGLPVFRPPQT